MWKERLASHKEPKGAKEGLGTSIIFTGQVIIPIQPTA
jgi:hypothetical protein